VPLSTRHDEPASKPADYAFRVGRGDRKSLMMSI